MYYFDSFFFQIIVPVTYPPTIQLGFQVLNVRETTRDVAIYWQVWWTWFKDT